jgi:RNA polymerase primary sigma factor
VDKYLKDVGKTELFPPGKESEAAFKARDGDQKAKDELIVRNLRYVIDVAKGYQGQGLPLEELIAEGNFGICKAAKRFDPEKGMKFITYAVWWIRQSILQALSENTRVVRIPINKINEIQKIRKIMEREMQTTGELSHSEYEVDHDILEMYSAFPVRLDSETSSEQPMIELFPNKDAVPPDSRFESESLRIDLETILDNLDDREIEILKYYHGIDEFRPFTLEEIGNILGLTRERIRQIKKKSLKKLRRNPKSRNLLDKYI